MNPRSDALGLIAIGKIILQHVKMNFIGQGSLLSEPLKQG
jgi:hypothetical protein